MAGLYLPRYLSVDALSSTMGSGRSLIYENYVYLGI